jgi:hypothetical protein
LVSDFGDRDRIDDMGDNSGDPVVTYFGLERRSGSGELMHLTQRREAHVIRDGRAHRIGPHDLALIVHHL